MKKKSKQKRNRFLYLAPRILSVIFILFLAMFSLDIFEGNYGFWGTILGLFMHNIPSLILLVIVIIAWKHELVGAIAFTLAGLLYIARLLMTILRNPPYQWYMLSWTLTIAGPAFLIGILFFLNWKRNRSI